MRSEHRQSRDAVLAFMRDRHMPQSLQARAMRHFQFSWDVLQVCAPPRTKKNCWWQSVLHLCVAHPLASTTSLQQPCRRFKCACVKHLRACTHARVCLGCAPDIFPLVLGHFQGGQDADASTLSLLPPGLRTEGLKHLHASAFVTVPMFKHTGKYDAFWRSLLERAEVRPSTLYIGSL